MELFESTCKSDLKSTIKPSTADCRQIHRTRGLRHLLFSHLPSALDSTALVWILQYVGFAPYVVFRGFPSSVSLALSISTIPSLIRLFVLGLVAGSPSFGGAYTAIPVVQVEAVLRGGWLPQSVFPDSIAYVLPVTLGIFATFVRFQGGSKDGGAGNSVC